MAHCLDVLTRAVHASLNSSLVGLLHGVPGIGINESIIRLGLLRYLPDILQFLQCL